MRVLCDQHVDQKYVLELQDAADLTVTTVRHVMRSNAPDDEIATYAATNNWVVLTSDDDFFTERRDHGLLFYHQLDDPLPGNLVAAIRAIEAACDDSSTIVEKVPGDWI